MWERKYMWKRNMLSREPKLKLPAIIRHIPRSMISDYLVSAANRLEHSSISINVTQSRMLNITFKN